MQFMDAVADLILLAMSSSVTSSEDIPFSSEIASAMSWIHAWSMGSIAPPSGLVRMAVFLTSSL